MLAWLLIGLFCGLGYWQFARGVQKKSLLSSFTQRIKQAPLTNKQWQTPGDWRFYPIKLTGHFDNHHTFLLDNKIFQGKVGYEIYTPFISDDHSVPILIDRGFMPLINHSRTALPTIRAIQGTVTLTGMLNTPPRYVALGNIQDQQQKNWPRRIEFIEPPHLAQLVGYPLSPYVILLDPQHPAAYPIEWQIVIMAPERHFGYAVQWFALAVTLLILFVALNRDRSQPNH